MALKELLSDIRGEGTLPIRQFRQPCVRAARLQLSTMFSEAESLPSVVELKEVAKRLSEAASRGLLSEVSRRDWSKAAWCLWLPNHQLITNLTFLKAYLARIFQANRRSLYKKLISAYLRDYDSTNSSVSQIGAFIAQGVVRWDWVWADRHRNFQFFDKVGPNSIAAACLTSDASVEYFLESSGLGRDFAIGGFAREAYVLALGKLGKLKDEQYDQALARVIEWSVEDDSLRYAGTEGMLADAMLLPWVNASPHKKTQQDIETFLLTFFKDPRISIVTGSKWSHVAPETKSVLLRWLVGAALEQFLQVVDAVVAMPIQWGYRRAFWMAYYDAGVIDEAWVAFASLGQVQAKKSFGEQHGFGKLDGVGISNDHAVLMMKIGGLTIADWSHNGKCHIWTQSKSSAPKLYKSAYYRDNLIEGSSNGGQIHTSARNGNWQGQVASYIGKHTNIRLDKNEYMPKRRR